jgi:hypothetical protein
LGELVKCKFLNHTHKPIIPVEPDISEVLTRFRGVGWTCLGLFLILGYPSLSISLAGFQRHLPDMSGS